MKDVSRYLIVALALLLVGCGGSGGGDDTSQQYTLTINVGDHGTVDLPLSGEYDAGQQVLMQSQPDDGYAVYGWTGVDSADRSAGTATVTMNGDTTVWVDFVWYPTAPLAIELLDAQGQGVDVVAGVDFGIASMNETLTRVFTVRNNGHHPLMLESANPVTITDQSGEVSFENMKFWFDVTSPTDTYLEMGESTTFAVSFKGNMWGSDTALMEIHSNDPTVSVT